MTLSYLTSSPPPVPRSAHGNKGMINNKTRAKIAQARAGETPEANPSENRFLRSDAWLPLPGPAPIAITDLTMNTCRWPIGDPLIGFCGHHTMPDPRGGNRPYCEAHTKRSMPTRSEE